MPLTVPVIGEKALHFNRSLKGDVNVSTSYGRLNKWKKRQGKLYRFAERRYWMIRRLLLIFETGE